MQRRVSRLALLASLLTALALSACGSSEEAAPPADTTPVVGALELPISRNHQATAPQNAVRIEVTPDTLRLDSREVLALERGRVPAAERSEGVLTRLREALQGAPARSGAALWVNANVPYATLVELLETLAQAGVREVHFAVRRGAGVETGWMRLARWRVVPAGDAPVTFSGTPVPWSAFASNWRAVYEACRAGQYIDCDAMPIQAAEGGNLQVDLWARGQGMKVTFLQVDAPPPAAPAAARGPALIEGVRAAPRAAAPAEPEPSVAEGAFNFRHPESVATESAISNAVRPVCGTQSCPAVVRADATTPSMRVLSMVGAFQPDGFAEAELAFRVPDVR